MKILFLTNLLPFPLDNGGKIKTYTTLNGLYKDKHEIDLICFAEQKAIDVYGVLELKKICSSVKVIYLRLTSSVNKIYMTKIAIKSLLSKYPFGVYKYISNEMKACLMEYLETYSYDLIYYDHLQLSVYDCLLYKHVQSTRRILDEHNCESTIVKRKFDSTKKFLSKTFFCLETKKYIKFERMIVKNMDNTFILSNEDYNNLRSIVGESFKHEIIPIGVKDRGIKRANNNKGIINILFLGTLTWEPNNSGIIWFLKNVMPKINAINNCMRLFIVGKNPSNELKEVSRSFDNVYITGYVESVDEYYDKCDFMIVPLFIGSGQRVKIIEAFSKGMPVLSTTIGAEGLLYVENRDILIADDEKEFVNKMMSLLSEKLRSELSSSGRKIYEKYYSMESIGKKIADSILD